MNAQARVGLHRFEHSTRRDTANAVLGQRAFSSRQYLRLAWFLWQVAPPPIEHSSPPTSWWRRTECKFHCKTIRGEQIVRPGQLNPRM
jgi:hypothetical protein